MIKTQFVAKSSIENIFCRIWNCSYENESSYHSLSNPLSILPVYALVFDARGIESTHCSILNLVSLWGLYCVYEVHA